MQRWIKRSVIGLGAVLALGSVVAAFGAYLGHAKRQRVVAIQAHPIELRSDARSVDRGRYLYQSRGCADCHGEDGGGRVFINDPGAGMRAAGPNISPGPGNVVARYGAADWERTLRHGVKPDGRPALIMPSEEFNRLTDDDLAAIVAYVRQLPPVAGGAAILDLPSVFPVLYGFGMVRDAAEKIDHSLAPSVPVDDGVTAEHGRYVGQMCQGCHGPQLSGGKVPGAPPTWPAAANLTPGDGSAMKAYANADAFKAMLRSGKRPDGSEVSRVMPFGSLAALNDVDADALYLYLRGLPPRATGSR